MNDKQFRQVRATNGMTEVYSSRRKPNKTKQVFAMAILLLALAVIGSPFVDKQIQKTIEWTVSMVGGFLPTNNDYTINYLNTD